MNYNNHPINYLKSNKTQDLTASVLVVTLITTLSVILINL